MQYAGTAAFAISAALLAGRRKMNVVGVGIDGVIVAAGGGTARDVLLGELPVAWLVNPVALLVAAIAAVATIAVIDLGKSGGSHATTWCRRSTRLDWR